MISSQLFPHLYNFCVIAKYKSFTKAAQKLNVTTANISYQIKILEERLNVVLFERGSGKRSELTEVGEKIAMEFDNVFEYVDKMIKPRESEHKDKIINIFSPLSFGTQLMMPAIKNIQKITPDISYNLQLSDSLYSSTEDVNVNLDVRIKNSVDDDNFEVVPLMNVKYLAVVSKYYLEKMPPLKSPSDLVNHKIICSERSCPFWGKFRSYFPDTVLPQRKNRLLYGNNHAQLYAVTEGIGIAIIPDYVLLSHNLKKNNIEIVLHDYFNDPNIHPVSTLYLSYHKLNIHRVQIEFFINFFKDYLRQQGKCVL